LADCRYIERLPEKSKNGDLSIFEFNKINNLHASKPQISCFSTVSGDIRDVVDRYHLCGKSSKAIKPEQQKPLNYASI